MVNSFYNPASASDASYGLKLTYRSSTYLQIRLVHLMPPSGSYFAPSLNEPEL